MQQFQASHEELSKLTSIASIQTKGLKRHFFEEAHPEKIKPKRDVQVGEVKLNSIAGSKRRKLLGNRVQEVSTDPNIVGFDSSDTSDSENETSIEDLNGNQDEPRHEEQLNEDKNVEDVDIVEQNNQIIEIKDDRNLIDKNEPTTLQTKTPTVYVHVLRSEEIQKCRGKLPIIAEEQQIMETINENPIVIIAGIYYS